MRRSFLLYPVRRAYFNGEPAVVPPAPAPAPAPTPTVPPSPGGRVFTQAEVDAINANHKRALQNQNLELVAQLTQLRENVNLTQQEKDRLDAQITALNQQHLTDTQRLTQQVEAWDKKYKEHTGELTQKLEGVTGEFHNLMIRNAITEGAAVHKAANPAQMQMLIGRHAKVIPETDKEGKPTGKLIPVLDVPVLDPKTKQTQLVSMPISDAIAEMKKDPANANLFAVEGSGGYGGAGNPSLRNSTGEQPNFAAMSPEQYRQYRVQQGIAKKTK